MGEEEEHRWFTDRFPDAWGFLGLGFALMFGMPALAAWISPHHTPWWVPGCLVLGAVSLLFAGILFTLPVLARFTAPHAAKHINVSGPAPPQHSRLTESPSSIVELSEDEKRLRELKRLFDSGFLFVTRIGHDGSQFDEQLFADFSNWADQVAIMLDHDATLLGNFMADPLPACSSWHGRINYKLDILRDIVRSLTADLEGYDPYPPEP